MPVALWFDGVPEQDQLAMRAATVDALGDAGGSWDVKSRRDERARAYIFAVTREGERPLTWTIQHDTNNPARLRDEVREAMSAARAVAEKLSAK
jgi:hypothetical protein